MTVKELREALSDFSGGSYIYFYTEDGQECCLRRVDFGYDQAGKRVCELYESLGNQNADAGRDTILAAGSTDGAEAGTSDSD
jgi:hypothetical protein